VACQQSFACLLHPLTSCAVVSSRPPPTGDREYGERFVEHSRRRLVVTIRPSRATQYPFPGAECCRRESSVETTLVEIHLVGRNMRGVDTLSRLRELTRDSAHAVSNARQSCGRRFPRWRLAQRPKIGRRRCMHFRKCNFRRDSSKLQLRLAGR